MSELKFDKDVVNGYKDSFDSEKNIFRNNSYSTYKYGYLKTSTEPLIGKMASTLDELYGKIDKGYSNINEYWTDYISANNSLETSLQSFSACCTDPVVNSYLSSFVSKIEEHYYSLDNTGVINFDEYYKNISVDENGTVTITMGNNGLSKFEKEYKNWCESNGQTVNVVCYKTNEDGTVDLTAANPDLIEKEQELILRCKEEGIDIKITQDVRTVEEQNELYASGRTKDGNIVTYVDGDDYDSDHQWGIAFDIYVNTGSSVTEYDEETYNKVGEIGKELGLGWGGDYETLVDKPHFYLTDYNTQELKEQYQNPGEFSKTWNIED